MTYLRGVRGVLGALLGTSDMSSGSDEATCGFIGVNTILGMVRDAIIIEQVVMVNSQCLKHSIEILSQR